MKRRRIILGCGIPAIIVLALAAAIAHRLLAPLPAPFPPRGEVVDAVTGQGIPGAQIKTSWTVSDYPMMDGYGSYRVPLTMETDEKGHFSLVIPDHRRGFFRTEIGRTIVRATGYNPIYLDDASAVTCISDEYVIIRLTPESGDADKGINGWLNQKFPGKNVVK